MHIHLPKALHGWRDFAKEVGIIVVGVLIALGAEQIVTVLHWREEVSDTRRALGSEIGASVRYAAIRLSVQQCLRDRVGDLADKLRTTSGHWAADPMPITYPHWLAQPKIAAVYRAPGEPWRTDAWETAKSTGALNHMPGDEVALYSLTYGGIAEMRDLDHAETSIEPRLSFLSYGQELDQRSRVDALNALAELDWINGTIATLSGHVVDGVRNLHLRLDRAAFAKELDHDIAEQRRIRGPCVKDVQIRV